MRLINEIIIHCSDSPWRRDDRAADIRQWHRAQGWKDIGYHFVIDLDGTIEKGRNLSVPGAHCYGHNAHSIGICYIGGRDQQGNPADTRTWSQRAALNGLIGRLTQLYRCRTVGHHDYNKDKPCPCFDAKTEYYHIYKSIVKTI